jgi:hypothetical protein
MLAPTEDEREHRSETAEHQPDHGGGDGVDPSRDARKGPHPLIVCDLRRVERTFVLESLTINAIDRRPG